MRTYKYMLSVHLAYTSTTDREDAQRGVALCTNAHSPMMMPSRVCKRAMRGGRVEDNSARDHGRDKRCAGRGTTRRRQENRFYITECDSVYVWRDVFELRSAPDIL